MDRNEHFPAETNHVYILGAGASHAEDKKFPLMNSVFKELETQDNDHSISKAKLYSNLLKWLKFNYSDYRSANIEDVLTYLDFLRENYIFSDIASKVDYLNIELHKIGLELIDYLQHVLNPIGDVEDLKLYPALVKRFKQVDSIISFNYDEIIDMAMIDYNKKNTGGENLPQLLNLQYLISKVSNRHSLFSPLGTTYRAESGIGVLLKLHGSLFWTTCLTSNCPNHFFINMGNEDYFIKSEEDYYKNPYYDLFPDVLPFCGLCGGRLERVFIYPSAFKQLSLFPKMRVLWQKAHRVLSAATHFVIIGYSLPETDFHVRNLLRQACYSGKGRSWKIVDPNWEVVLGRLKPLIAEQSHSVTFFLRCYNGFAEYLRDEYVEGIDYQYLWNL